MTSAKHLTSISRLMNIFEEWDKGSTNVRKKILKDFLAQNQNKTGPELEQEFALAASLFFTRLTSWLRLTYMTSNCLSELLQAVRVFLAASSGHKFMGEFMEVGGTLTLLEIIGLKQAKETDKAEALECLYSLASGGRKYKELICESYGIRAVAECLAKSTQEETQNSCKNLLLVLAQGNPKFQNQVYKGLIALLPCSSPKAQQLACSALRVVQPIVGSANAAIVEPLLGLLRTFHLEIQYEAIELLKDLMHYEVSDSLLAGLVSLLRPAVEESSARTDNYEDVGEFPGLAASLPLFVQQAAAAKAIGILARESQKIAERLVELRVTHNLMYAMGNKDHADSQRQASITLEYFCRTFSIVDDHVRDAMGETLYDLFMITTAPVKSRAVIRDWLLTMDKMRSNPETLYLNISHIQADVLVSNKVNIPKCRLKMKGMAQVNIEFPNL